MHHAPEGTQSSEINKNDLRWWHVLTAVVVLMGSTAISLGTLYLIYKWLVKMDLLTIALVIFIGFVLFLRFFHSSSSGDTKMGGG